MNGPLNEQEFRRFVAWLIERGVHGLYPNGSTGEFTRFTPEERRRIVQVVAEEAAGRVPILAGAAKVMRFIIFGSDPDTCSSGRRTR